MGPPSWITTTRASITNWPPFLQLLFNLVKKPKILGTKQTQWQIIMNWIWFFILGKILKKSNDKPKTWSVSKEIIVRKWSKHGVTRLRNTHMRNDSIKVKTSGIEKLRKRAHIHIIFNSSFPLFSLKVGCKVLFWSSPTIYL